MLHTEVRTEGGVALVVRRAEGPAVAVLRATGERLQHAAHPGVVQLVRSEGDDHSWELQLAHAGRRLDGIGPLDVLTAARLLAGVVSILADLHDLGIVHGRLDASHVLIGPHGQPVLCGFGPDAGGREPADDVAAVGTLLVDLVGGVDELEPIPERRWRRQRGWTGWQRRSLLLIADQACAEPPTRRPTARRLAAAIAEAVPAADHHPAPVGVDGNRHTRTGARDGTDASMDVEPRPDNRRGGLLPLGLVALVAVVGIRVLRVDPAPTVQRAGGPAAVESDLGQRADRLTEATAPNTSTTTSTTSTTGTTLTRRNEQAQVTGNVVTMGAQRFEVGIPGDRVVLGDWDCDGVATPAVLRPDTGSVFAFTRWADTEPLTAVALQVVPGAVDVQAVATDEGCDRLLALQSDGTRIVVSGVSS
jgi:hypothetical protein